MEKFYKKATALALVCAMSVMLTACGDSNSNWKAASSSLENSVEDAIAAGNTEPEASPIDASSLEDCAYALPDPTGEEAKAEQERFHTYLMDNFKESVTSDTSRFTIPLPIQPTTIWMFQLQPLAMRKSPRTPLQVTKKKPKMKSQNCKALTTIS